MNGDKLFGENQTRENSAQLAEENDVVKLERYLEEVIGTDEYFSSALSERERQILQYIVRGMTNREIAEKLSVVKRTVEYHRSKIMEHLGVENFAELMMVVFSKV